MQISHNDYKKCNYNLTTQMFLQLESELGRNLQAIISIGSHFISKEGSIKR